MVMVMVECSQVLRIFTSFLISNAYYEIDIIRVVNATKQLVGMG
jgi:hypothetical protein